MPNCYVDLDTFKASDILGIPEEDKDVRLLQLLENVSREIDKYCHRHFYPLLDTKYFSGIKTKPLRYPRDLNSGAVAMGFLAIAGEPKAFLPDDLISVTSLKEDTYRDGTYPTLWDPVDYYLSPRDAKPSGPIDIVSPYTYIEVNTSLNGNYSVFKTDQYIYKLDGKWGYCDVVLDTGQKIADTEDITKTQLTMDVVDGTKVRVGWTCLIESEQVYITAITDNKCTIQRGINNTEATTHAKDTAIYRYLYPGGVVEACMMQAARLWTRRSSGYGTSFVEVTQAISLSGLDKDVKEMLSGYKKTRTRMRVL